MVKVRRTKKASTNTGRRAKPMAPRAGMTKIARRYGKGGKLCKG